MKIVSLAPEVLLIWEVDALALAKTHIRKDDTVMVITGKDAGTTGKVIQVLPAKGQSCGRRCERRKRHTKPTQKNPQGGIVEKPAAIDASNVMLYCGKCKKSNENQKKTVDNKNVRVSKHCGEAFDK